MFFYQFKQRLENSMGKIFCIIGKSSTGKDTIYQELLTRQQLNLKKIVPYTTRPIREGEVEGETYHYVTVEEMNDLEEQGKIIESRYYNTIHGIWHYFTAQDEQIHLESQNYLFIGTLEAYSKIKIYYGNDRVIPIYIEIDDGERLTRALNREKKQIEPKYEEMCRRFLADCQDFSEKKIQEADISKRFENDQLEKCLNEISEYILQES